MKKEGEVCTASEQCPTNLACIKQGTDTDFKCTKYWSLKDGTKFDSTYLRSSNNFIPVNFLVANDLCASHNAWIADLKYLNQRECRKPRTGNYTSLDELKRPNGPKNDCGYVEYTNATDKTHQITATDVAKCGFNKDSVAYCDKRKGDVWFQTVLKKVQSLNLSGLKCHALSALTTCGSALTTVGKDLFKEWRRELLTLDESNVGWAIYANNDNCVATSMTAEYWQGDSPDFAFGSFNIRSFTIVLLTMLALF